MPTVSLTPQQQAQIDAANAALASAQADYNAKKYDADQEYKNVKQKYDAFLAAECKYPFQPSLEEQISGYGALNPESCGFKLGCNKEECLGYVSVWNVHYKAWTTKDLLARQSKQALDSAKANLDKVLDAIAKDPTIAANQSILEEEVRGEKNKEVVKWLFFGAAVILIVWAAIKIGSRMFGRTATTA